MTCQAVVAESCYLLRKLPAAVNAILEYVARGVFQIPFQLSRSAAELAQNPKQVSGRPADLADACLIYAAGQLGVGEKYEDFR